MALGSDTREGGVVAIPPTTPPAPRTRCCPRPELYYIKPEDSDDDPFIVCGTCLATYPVTLPTPRRTAGQRLAHHLGPL